MDWTTLGIEPTKDKQAITAAYRARLVNANPEDRPEEFKALRAAYEEALRLADEDEPQRDDSPLGRLTDRIRETYDDFPARIDPDAWRALLADELFLSLDTRPQAEEALLRFLLDNYSLPHEVIVVLDQEFSWVDRAEELYEDYPRDFVDYVIVQGVRYEPELPYSLHSPGKNAGECDALRGLYYRGSRAPLAELPHILEQIDALGEWHPYVELLRARMLSGEEKDDEARDLLDGLIREYPEDRAIQLFCAEFARHEGRWDEVGRLCRQIVDKHPGNRQAIRMLAESMAARGDYLEAKELIYDAMDLAGGDSAEIDTLSGYLRQWSEELIPGLAQAWEDDPTDEASARELCWCYLQTDQAAVAGELVERLQDRESDPFDYYNLRVKTALNLEDYETALRFLAPGQEILGSLVPDGTARTERRISKIPEYLQIESICLQQLGHEEESAQALERALEADPDNPQTLGTLARFYYDRDLSKALRYATRLTEVNPDVGHTRLLLANILFDLRRDQDAFNEVNRALDLDGSMFWGYILKLRILLRNEAWDGVRDVLAFMREHGVTDQIDVDFIEAQLIELDDQDYAAALEAYRALAQRMEDGEPMDEPAELYLHMAYVAASGRDINDPEVRQEIMDLVDKGLSLDPRHQGCLEHKAWLYKVAEKNDEAIKIYRELEGRPNHGLSVEHNLAFLYYRDRTHHLDDAIRCFEYLIENDERDDYYFYLGNCYRDLYDYAAAERAFLREMELAPEDPDANQGLSYVYDFQGDFERALEQIDQQIWKAEEYDMSPGSAWPHKARILRRLGRPREALAVLDELAQREEKPDYKTRFLTCCQFAMWDEAAQTLRQWEKSDQQEDSYQAGAVHFATLRGNYDDARAILAESGKDMPEWEYDAVFSDLAEATQDTETLLEYRERLARKNGDDSHYPLNYAETLALTGDVEAAREWAERALEVLEDEMDKGFLYRPLFRARKAMALACAGRMDEAHEELAQVRAMHLCEHCEFDSCKDALAFEAKMYELSGDLAKARELYEAGHEKWPGELDFISGLNRVGEGAL